MRFGNFEVLTDADGRNCQLGGGAFGKTYKARHLFLKRVVALKVLHDRYANDLRARERFLREAQAAHDLKHPHIAEVLDFGESEGCLYYAMEFCSGGDLEQYIKARAPVPPIVSLRFARQICLALAYAHERNFYHRDLKPPNVMLARAEGEPVLKLIDFGLVKLGLSDATDSGLTMAGEVLGTPMFASPEQLREENLDHRSDLFSLGMTLWYLLEGSPPVPGTAMTVMAERLSEKTYDRLFSLRVPTMVRPMLSKLLEKDPADRYQDAAAVLVALDEVINQLDPAAKEVRSALTPSASDTVFQTAITPGMGEILALGGEAPLPPPSPASSQAGVLPAREAAAADERIPQPASAPITGSSSPPPTRPPRLQFLRALGDTVLGEARLATERATDFDVVAVQLQEGLDVTDTWPARIAGAAQSVPQRLTADLPLVTQMHEDRPYAVAFCAEPVRLVQILQARGNLPFLEASQVLSQIALIMDESRGSGRRHDLQLNQIHLAPLAATPHESVPAASLAPASLDQWPPFLVCVPIRTVSTPGHLEDDRFGDETQTAMLTMRSTAADEFLSPNAAFGGLLFRLITGGEPRPAMYRSKNNYRPIPNLSREGNQVLAGCLEGSFNNETLTCVLEKMMRAEKGGVMTSTSTRSTASAISPLPQKGITTRLAEKSTSGITKSAPPSPAKSSATSVPGKNPLQSIISDANKAAPLQTPPPGTPVPGRTLDVPASPRPAEAHEPEPKPGPKAKAEPKTKPRSTEVAKPSGPKPSGVPPVVLVAAGASLLILMVVVGAGVYTYQSWKSSQTTQPVTSEPPPTPTPTPPKPPEMVKAPDPPPKAPVKPLVPPEPPKTPPPAPPTPPVVEKKEPPPKPKPPKELVFTQGIKPATARVKVNGRPMTLGKNSDNQLTLNLSSFSDYPLSILISPPPGFAAGSQVIDDPASAVYDKAIVFKRAESSLTIPGNEDYEKAELTFVRLLPEEAASFAGEPDNKPPVKTVDLDKDSHSAKVQLPTGMYRVVLTSSNKNVAPRVLATEHSVPPGPSTTALAAPTAWAGAYECQFFVSEGDIQARCHRILRFKPGLAEAELVEDWSHIGKGSAPAQTYVIDTIKLDADGTLTGILRTLDARAKDKTFDEIVEMKHDAKGNVTFLFYPVPEATNFPREKFQQSGTMRVLSGGD